MSDTAGLTRRLSLLLRALVITAMCLTITGCVQRQPEETRVHALEAELLNSVHSANGVFVYLSSSGFGNTSVSVRLYLDDVSDPVVIDAVRTAFDVTWHTWNPQASIISLEVMEGAKPAEPKRLDSKDIDISAAAGALGLPLSDPYYIITFDVPRLKLLFGESGH